MLLVLAGENPFKSRAYDSGARIVESYDGPIEQLVKQALDGQVKGIGKALAEKLQILAQTGQLPYLTQLEASFPEGLTDLLRIQGLGPKKVKKLHDDLGIITLGELEYACQENRLVDLPGFGQKSQQNVLTGIENSKKFAGRFHLHTAQDNARELIERLEASKLADRLSVCGSIRRGKETNKDIDILAVSDRPEKLMEAFGSGVNVEQVLAQGKAKTSVILASGMSADLRVVENKSFAAAQVYFTGSKDHNTQLHALAKKQKRKLNEYGLFENDMPLPITEEKDLYRALGLQFIPPCIREGTGEIEAAALGRLPELITEQDIRGVIHAHTNASDGTETLEAMAQACRDRGYGYFGVSDHSQTAAYAGGLKPDQIEKQRAQIDAFNASHEDFRVFSGIESDILPDGSLDYESGVLATLDFVIVSIHSGFGHSQSENTLRVVRAVENPFTRILGHPTGRLLLGRKGYAIDMDKVIDACAANNVAIELNANPYRLDIDWRRIRDALAKGVKIAINPDAHSIKQIDFIRIGVAIARKGWCEPADVINTLDAAGIEQFFLEGR